MSRKKMKGSHHSVPKGCGRAIDALLADPAVKKLTLGYNRASRTGRPPGTLRIHAELNGGIRVLLYHKQGILELMLYGPDTQALIEAVRRAR